MARYKTSDGRVITLGELYTEPIRGSYIYPDNIKSIGSSFFPFPKKYDGPKYTYDFVPSECVDFSLIGDKSTLPVHFKDNYTDSSRRFTINGGGSFGVANNFNGNTGRIDYTGGIIPPYTIFVLASQQPGTYTAIYSASLAYNDTSKRNFYYAYDITSLTLSFFNNVNNVIAEKDSSPVADEQGIYDDSSDIITLPNIDVINACSGLATSGLKAHKLTASNVTTLFSKFWSTDFFDTIIKNQQAPIDNIVSLSTFPFSVTDNGTSGAVEIGTVDMGITAPIVTSQFQEIDFGTIKCSEYYGNSLDYTDTTVSIFLPFIGQKDLDINIIGNAEISLVYRVDIMTGNCNAIISAKRERDGTLLDSVLYIFTGNVGNQIPVTQQQNQTLIKAQEAVQTAVSGAAAGNIRGGVAGGLSSMATEGMTSMLTGQATVRYTMSGNLTTANGFMGVMTPFLIWSRPVNVKPSGYDKYYGYPSFFTRTLSECKGYTKIHELISDAPTEVPADDWETIKQMLKDGIIIN